VTSTVSSRCAGTEPARHLDPGFNCNDHPALSFLRSLCGEARLLVDLQPEAVASGVGEPVGEACAAENGAVASSTSPVTTPRGRRRRPPPAPRARRRRRCARLGGAANVDGAGHVGAVAIEEDAESRVRIPRRGSFARVAWPWGRAERSPLAMNGLEGHSPFGAGQARRVLQSAATAISVMPAWIEVRMRSNRDGQPRRARRAGWRSLRGP